MMSRTHPKRRLFHRVTAALLAAALMAGAAPVSVRVENRAVSFADVSDDSWFKSAVNFVTARNLFSGISSQSFAPITREQLATILYRYAAAPMQWATAQGIISGRGNNTLDPKGTASRAEVAQMLMNQVAR